MICKMKKLTIVGLVSDRKKIINSLMCTENVQLKKIDNKISDTAYNKSVFEDFNNGISEVESELSRVEGCIRQLSSSMTKKQINSRCNKKTEMSKILSRRNYDGIWHIIFDIDHIFGEVQNQKLYLSELKSKLNYFSVYNNLNFKLDCSNTKNTRKIIGQLHYKIDLGLHFEEIAEKFKMCHVEKLMSIDNIKQNIVCYIFHSDISDDLQEYLSNIGFVKLDHSAFDKPIPEMIIDLNIEIQTITENINSLNSQFRKYHDSLYKIKSFYDYLYNKRERHLANQKLLSTQNAFILQGWIKSDEIEKLKDKIETEFCTWINVQEPVTDEDVPIALKNNRFTCAFEMITTMYGMPKYDFVDPNPIMSVFYFLFFGIMLGDASYGLILMGSTSLYLYLVKPSKYDGMGQLARLLFSCGLSTVFWGIMFGSWFGDLFSSMFNIKLKALWFNPASDPIKLLVFSLILGAIHIMTGLAMKAYLLLRRKRIWDAVFDVGFWYLLFFGMGFFLLGNHFAVLSQILIGVGLLGLISTQGRHEKSLLSKIFSGILSLYGIIGYFGDVLSYARLLALGLSTTIIANVVNTMSSISGLNSMLSFLVFIAIFTIGHVFNLVMNSLGAYVHTSRLQYMEFYGKFYETGGRCFEPLRVKTKYLKIY